MKKKKYRPETKNLSHADMEKKRRDTLNERFEELLSLLPDLKEQKPNKETILRKASEYIVTL